MKSVMLDPGHGGANTGARNLMGTPSDPRDDVFEKNLALQLAYLTVPLLQELGVKPWLTRTGDEAVSLPARARQSNEIGADLFISLHFNAPPPGIAMSGFECFHAAPSIAGKRIATRLIEHCAERFPEARNRGVKPDSDSQHSSLYVLRHTRAPAILFEPSFITDMPGLLWAYRNMLGVAECIAETVSDYFGGVSK